MALDEVIVLQRNPFEFEGDVKLRVASGYLEHLSRQKIDRIGCPKVNERNRDVTTAVHQVKAGLLRLHKLAPSVRPFCSQTKSVGRPFPPFDLLPVFVKTPIALVLEK
jgi:hypothetical protein